MASSGVIGGGLESIEDGSMKDPCTLLQCRTVRIGSYKVVPRDKILISTEGIRLAVPALQDETETTELWIESAEIRRVLIHFGRGIPVIFFCTYKNTAERLRNILKMTSKEGPYYDPDSQDETQRRITLLLHERISEESKLALKRIFGSPVEVLVEITSKEANELLVRTSPKEVTRSDEEVESLRKENVSLKNVQADREGRDRNASKRARQENMQLAETRNAHTDQRSQVQKRVAEQTKEEDSARLISLKSEYERRIARLEKENAELRADKQRESELANQMLTLVQRQLEKVTEEVKSLHRLCMRTGRES